MNSESALARTLWDGGDSVATAFLCRTQAMPEKLKFMKSDADLAFVCCILRVVAGIQGSDKLWRRHLCVISSLRNAIWDLRIEIGFVELLHISSCG